VLAHPVKQLSRHLHQSLFGQHMRVAFKVVVGHELDNVSRHVLAIGSRIESLLIAVQCLHRTEISIANANNDDSHGQFRAADDLINRPWHVIDDTVRYDNKDVELLGAATLRIEFDMVAHLREELTKVRRAVESALLKRVLVALDDTLNTVDTRVENVAVQREAV